MPDIKKPPGTIALQKRTCLTLTKDNFHRKLSELAQNALLHLYSTVQCRGRFVSTEKRNEIVVKFLKPKLKDPDYKSVKGEIKTFVLIGRKKNSSVEKKLIELNAKVQEQIKKSNDTQKLFEMLKILEKDHGFKTKLLCESEESEPEVIYVLKDHIEHCLSDSGEQVAPVLLQLESKRYRDLATMIEETGMFKPEVSKLDDETCQVHILLHRLDENILTI